MSAKIIRTIVGNLTIAAIPIYAFILAYWIGSVLRATTGHYVEAAVASTIILLVVSPVIFTGIWQLKHVSARDLAAGFGFMALWFLSSAVVLFYVELQIGFDSVWINSSVLILLLYFGFVLFLFQRMPVISEATNSWKSQGIRTAVLVFILNAPAPIILGLAIGLFTWAL